MLEIPVTNLRSIEAPCLSLKATHCNGKIRCRLQLPEGLLFKELRPPIPFDDYEKIRYTAVFTQTAPNLFIDDNGAIFKSGKVSLSLYNDRENQRAYVQLDEIKTFQNQPSEKTWTMQITEIHHTTVGYFDHVCLDPTKDLSIHWIPSKGHSFRELQFSCEPPAQK